MNKKVLICFIYVFIFLILFETLLIDGYATDTKVIINDLDIELKASPKVINGITYVPFCPILKALGWKVSWNISRKTASSTKGDEKIELRIGSTDAILDGEQVKLENPPIIINSTPYIQSSFIAKHFGVRIKLNEKENLIILSNDNTNKVVVNGEGNIVIAGNGIIVNIIEPYSNDILSDMVDRADRLLEDNKFNDALLKYTDILENFFEEENPLIYMHVMNNMGNAYIMLAEIKDTKMNALYAVASYKKALKYYPDDSKTNNYYITLNNLGNAYSILAEVTGDKVYSQKAVLGYEEALKFYLPENDLIGYALLQYKLGKQYLELNNRDSFKECMVQAEASFEKAAENITVDDSIYPVVQYNLGNTYMLLSQIQDEEGEFERSKGAYEEALKVWTVESFPLNYAWLHKCLGDAYMGLYKQNSSKEDLINAIENYNEGLTIYSFEEYPVYFAKLSYDLSCAYMEQTETGSIAQAISTCRESLKVFNIKGYPVYYKNAVKLIKEAQQKLANKNEKNQ
jgi:tetratricopeptide (TPR) repeat protein